MFNETEAGDEGGGEERRGLALAPHLAHGTAQIEVPGEIGVWIGQQRLRRIETRRNAAGDAGVVMILREAGRVAVRRHGQCYAETHRDPSRRRQPAVIHPQAEQRPR